ncbi:S8 family serine peptidase [Brunnivagina elsteri]|uniref:Peptidase S8 and S53 subtilisin kexin sedolisin n=1 Tax=Brunnivagina elsteri CCALA 953 TaxID=987040 RepID=A0A2A2TEH6_9CYAN|nr:S8 family serine peptidase [Calothrix elsteri]PAX52101.1 peptidase S8 and S53 subtilisin kexin sedolisin [Calothrix elsteri CCALA 953]
MTKKQTWIIFGLSAACLTTPVLALTFSSSIDSLGIDALRLHKNPYNLTGNKIGIGQVEIGRPGKFGVDKAVSSNHVLPLVAVFLRNGPAKSNNGVDPHAHNVAGVMVSKDKAFPGVAPNARLYSAAVGSTKSQGQPEECLTAQHIATQNGGDVRAINFSFGEPLNRDPRPDAVLDGKALLTMCVDWSSRVHDVLYAIAGNQGKGGIPIPTDNYNAMNVAFSSRREQVFNKVDVSNLAAANEGATARLAGKEINLGSRRSVAILSPGSNIRMLNPDGKVNKVTGTSFAAPHLTGTVALLQEFGDRELKSKKANWSIVSRRHEVMKAVLLNSADKIKDNGDGLRLGMTRTVIDKQNQDWLASDAYKDAKIPLHAQMGTGHLNASRALQQFSAGQWQSNQSVPALGWDYNTVTANNTVDYVLAKPLKANSFVAVTLTWDRLIELEEKNNNQMYEEGENFRDRGLNNLDLYLVQEGGNNNVAACSSVSDVDNAEHIFCPVPAAGKYQIRVQYKQQINESKQPYALAWWTVPGN